MSANVPDYIIFLLELGHFHNEESFELAYKKEGDKFVDMIEQIGIKFSKDHLSYVANLKARKSEFVDLCGKHSINAYNFGIPIGQKYNLQVCLQKVKDSIDRSRSQAMYDEYGLDNYLDDLYGY